MTRRMTRTCFSTQPQFLRLLPHLVLVPAQEARRLRHRPAVVKFVLEVADIGLRPRLT